MCNNEDVLDISEENRENSIRITAVHIGKITDLGIKDANNMGAAMAPVSGRIRP